jgi:predicted nucleic acid-binding Zn ribbon protein
LSADRLRPAGRNRPKRSESPETLGSVLEGLLNQWPWSGGVAVGELGRRWAEVVGDTLARECTPAGIQDGVLLVRATSAPWAAQLRFLQRELAARANEILGSERVREVRVTVAS